MRRRPSSTTANWRPITFITLGRLAIARPRPSRLEGKARTGKGDLNDGKFCLVVDVYLFVVVGRVYWCGVCVRLSIASLYAYLSQGNFFIVAK